jgi:hypothetical protein
MRALAWLPALLLGCVSIANAQVAEPVGDPAATDRPATETSVETPATTEADATLQAEPSADPAAADASATGGEFELSEQELLQLGFTPGADAAAVAVDTAFQIGGYADFGGNVLLVPKRSIWRQIEGPWQKSFAIGNFNLYLSKNLNEDFRMMGEVRFLYLPNGRQPADTTVISRYDGTAPDYNDFNRPLSWGGIEIERVYLEWSIHQYLSVRIGQFLTPYGIWNVDHGSPTIIPIERPFVIGMEVFPERQTGFEFFGRYEVSASNTLGYHATLSNGAGPASEWLDPDDNKAIGGRAYWEHRSLGELRVGASAYYGQNTDAISYTIFGPEGPQFPKKINSQYAQLALAADVQWKYHNLHMQAEVLSQQRNYTEEGRTLQPNNANGQPSYFADWHSYGAYFLVGYRLPWLGIMPYALVMAGTFNIAALRMSPLNGTFGINIRPTESVVFKLEYIHTHPWPNDYFKDELRRLGAQVSWAF